MTTKMKKFCQEYMSSGNATESAKRAGYAEKTAYSQGQRLLKNVEVQKELQRLAEELASSKIATAKEVQEFLTSTIRGEETEDVVVVEGCGDGVSEATIKKKKASLKDRISASNLLMKMQGQLDNNVNLNMVLPVFGGEDDLEE